MENEESLMICIDNSSYMKYFDPYRFELQIQCIRLYCQLKLKSNPKTAIGILTMGSHNVKVILEPTSDLEEILLKLRYDFHLGSSLKFEEAIMISLICFPLDKASKSKRKRIYLFTGGGCIHLNVKEMENIGKSLKEWGVAVDVFNFLLEGPKFKDSKMALDAFVAAAVNDNDNEHIIHFAAEPTASLDEIIKRFPQIFSGASPEEVMIARTGKTKDSKRYNEWVPQRITQEWVTVEKVPMSEDEFTPTTGSSKCENETPPDAAHGERVDHITPWDTNDDCSVSFNSLIPELYSESMISKDRFSYVYRELTQILEIVKSMPS